MTLRAYTGAAIHDGMRLHSDCALLRDGDQFVGICATTDLPADTQVTRLDGGVLAPGLVDLQVNGGGGLMFNNTPCVDTIRTIALAHAKRGTAAILPTLITTTPDTTRAAIAAVADAIAQGVPGILGLHLEGPHLSVSRCGAHDPALIRSMTEDELRVIFAAAEQLPDLMVTIAPENVSRSQVAAMAEAGVIVSLGHTDADFDTCCAYIAAGAHTVTHLFNAMSQLSNRAPGLVGAALDQGQVSAGLIADGIHVHPAVIAAAVRAKAGPGKIFLVSDAMATAGSDIQQFDLDGRTIVRGDGRLTLVDGTLAGADIDLAAAVRVMVTQVGVSIENAVAMATSAPTGILKNPLGYGQLQAGTHTPMAHFDSTLRFTRFI